MHLQTIHKRLTSVGASVDSALIILAIWDDGKCEG
jgi:hypothetical protein